MEVEFGITKLSNRPEADGTSLRLADGPLELSWHHCSTTSDFLGDFYATQARKASLDYNETRHGIGYLVNELLENAIKFRAAGDISVETSLDGTNFEIRVVNNIDETTSTRFRALLGEITSRDPGDLLIEKIESNAANPSSTGSGLGLLTLMSDYGVRLGWIFHEPASGGAPTRLETFAALTLA